MTAENPQKEKELVVTKDIDGGPIDPNSLAVNAAEKIAEMTGTRVIVTEMIGLPAPRLPAPKLDLKRNPNKPDSQAS